MSDNFSGAQKLKIILSLTLLISLTPIATAIVSGALPFFEAQFGVTTDDSQLVLTIFVVGIGLGVFLSGPTIKKFGAIYMVKICLGTALVGILLCITAYFTETFALLLLGRFITALGTSIGSVCAPFLNNALFTQEQAKSNMAYLTVFATLAASVSISLGSFLVAKVSWLGIFICLAFLVILTFFSSFFIPRLENVTQTNMVSIPRLLAGYVNALKNKETLLFGFLMGTYAAFNFLYSATAPYIAARELNLDSVAYGSWNMLNLLGICIGTVLSLYFAQRIDAMRLLRTTLMCALALAHLLLLYAFSPVNPPWIFFTLTSALFACGMLILPTATVLGIALSNDKASAASVMGLFNMGTGLLALFLLRSLQGSEFSDFVSLIVILNGLGLALLFLHHYRRV